MAFADKMTRVKAVRDAERPEMERRYKEASKQRLLRTIEKKCKTLMIGALAQFEQIFGRDLWGYGKDDSDKTQEELIAYELWQKCRTNILNNGNNQIRAIDNEVQNYEVKWLRYQLNLPVKKQGE